MAPFPLRPRRWEARVVSVPMDESINTPIYTFPSVESVFVRVTDADGATGYGYLWCFGERQAKLLVAAVEYLASYVNDCDLALPDLLARARREINFLGYKGVTVFALSAVDMALTDLLCRRLGRSLSSVLGSRRSRIATYWSGLFLNRSLEELGHEVEVAHDGLEAVRMASALQPDVVLLDIAMPGPATSEVVAGVRRAAPGAAIVALSGYGPERLDADTVAELAAHLPKTTDLDAVRRTLRAAGNG